MGKRQEKLERLIKPYRETSNKIQKLGTGDFNEAQLREITKIYNILGGIQKAPPINYGKYDIVFNDFVLELDEENHFNRYRLKTLESSIYKQNKGFNISNYKKYCQNFESKCRAYGKFWTNGSTEKQFGSPGENGNLSKKGSPRWKQRAYYDFLKDHLPIVSNIPIVRLSVYDEFQGISLDKILSMDIPEKKYGTIIWEEIVSRIE